MTHLAATDFSTLLRRLRLAAGLSQDLLAERAGIGVEAISRYERGLRRAPRRETVASLIAALQLSGEAKAEFEETALRRPDSPPSSHAERTHNLPWQPTSFIGRHREIEDISNLLTPRRLVTITGAGGIGKTRTALEIASRLSQCPRDGVWFVDLAPIYDGSLLLSKLASVLDLQLPEQDDILIALIAAIEHRELLLILDNCEHIITTVRSVAESILIACPQITLLATSRERIGIAGERAYKIPRLPVPSKRVTTASEGRTYDALELFAERAATAQHGFHFSDDHVGPIADICRRLDGIALAIELAAARLPVLGLSELRKQLTEHFRVIAGGRHDLPARQQTLFATISWSHELLSEQERVLFRRLAIFANGWTLDAAENVCSDNVLEKAAVQDALFSLVEKSLVVLDIDAATPRYSFFESTRAFALERLAAGIEEPGLPRRHAQWTANFADRAFSMHARMPRVRWQIEVEPELDNALAALEWAFGSEGDTLLAGQIASGLQGFWHTAALATCGRRYINAALEHINAREHPDLVARLLLAQFRFLHGESGANAMKRAILLLENGDDRQTLARCYGFLSYSLAQTGQYSDAEDAHNKASDIANLVGLGRSVFYSKLLSDRSSMLRMQGRFDEASAALTEALSLTSDLEGAWFNPLSQMIIAEAEFAAGRVQRAVTIGEEALANARRLHGGHQETYSLCNLACFQLVLGELDSAEANAQEALRSARTSNAYVVQAAIQHLAAIAALRGNAKRATHLLGYVNAWYESAGCVRDSIDQKSYDLLVESLRNQLSDVEIAALAARGAQFTEDAAVAEALTWSCAKA